MKNYWEQWEWRLWLGDPNLGMCQPATRGIWMDALCAMMERSTDRLSGTQEQLAQVCRCPVAALSVALDDMETQGAAEIHRHDGIVTIISRKRRRDMEIHAKRAAAGKKGMDNRYNKDPNKTPNKQDNKNRPSSDCDCDCSFPSLEEFQEEAARCLVLPAESKDLWLKCQTRQWRDAADVPIREWRSYLHRHAPNIIEARSLKRNGNVKPLGYCP
jgi:hypothetical protein